MSQPRSDPPSTTEKSEQQTQRQSRIDELKLYGALGAAAVCGIAWLIYSYYKSERHKKISESASDSKQIGQSEQSSSFSSSMMVGDTQRRIANTPGQIPISNKRRRIPEFPNGPEQSDPETGNLTDMAEAGSLHQYIVQLTAEYGPIGSFWWGDTRVVYVSDDPYLFTQLSMLKLDRRPPLLFQAFKPLIGEYSIQYCNGREFWLRYHKIYRRSFGAKSIRKYLPMMNDFLNQSLNAIESADSSTSEFLFVNGALSPKAEELDDSSLKMSDDTLLGVPVEPEKEDDSKKHLFRAMTDSFTLSARLFIRVVCGNFINVPNELIDAVVDGYHKCWSSMEKSLIYGEAQDSEQFEKDLKSMKDAFNGIGQLIDVDQLRVRLSKVETAKRGRSDDSDAFESSHAEDLSFLESIWLDKDRLYHNDFDRRMDELVTGVTGGIHTTANAVAWTLYYLACDPEGVQSNARAEVIAVLDRSSDETSLGDSDSVQPNINITNDHISQMKYLKMVAQESIRISCLAPWVARCSTDDIILGVKPDSKSLVNHSGSSSVSSTASVSKSNMEYLIPGETPMILSIGALLESDHIWGAATVGKYEPTRFNMDTDERNTESSSEDAEIRRRNAIKRAFMPFGGVGKRICPGWHLFYTEHAMIVAHLLSRFRIKLYEPSDQNSVEKVYGLVTHMSKDVSLIFEPL